MKVEEIKLALEKNRETHLNLSIQSDTDSAIEQGNKLLSEANDFIKRAQLSASMAEKSFQRGIQNADKGITAKKELGEDTKFYDQRKEMAKDGLNRSLKASKINII